MGLKCRTPNFDWLTVRIIGSVLVGTALLLPATAAFAGVRLERPRGVVIPIPTKTDEPGQPITFDAYPNSFWIAPNGRVGYLAGGTGSGWTVTPIDLRTTHESSPISVGMEPSGFAITPDGKTLYVLDGGGETAGAQGGDITPINTATNQPMRALLNDTAPTSMAMTPNGKTLYVTDDGSVYPINVATDEPGPAIPISGGPFLDVVSPNGRTVYVLSYDGAVTPIDVSNDIASQPIKVGPQPFGFAMVMAPDGKHLYVLDTRDIPGSKKSGVVREISTSTNLAGPAVKVSPSADSMVISPSGTTLYVAASSQIQALDTRTHALTRLASAPMSTEPLAIAPNGKVLYAALEQSNAILQIPIVAGATTRKIIKAGASPVEITITPNGQEIYVLDFSR